MKNIKVVKESGEVEPFSEQKLEKSIQKAGVTDNVLSRWVINEIKKSIHQKVSTSHIREKVFNLLSKQSLNYALRYRLKDAIMELGPSGHPFEKFVARILEYQGYSVKTNVLMKGRCVLHEVDVLAQREGKKIIVEAKYHNERGIKTDVKVAMYVKARFEDINFLKNWDEIWLITNTKFTFDAQQYAVCAGIKVVGWNYPEGGESLQRMIENNNLYPLTILTSLDGYSKRKLLEKGLTLVKDITPALLSSLHLKSGVLKKVEEEIKSLSD